ncbi:MAG: GntR family transcriptional regulator [Acidobacteriota bacterium]
MPKGAASAKLASVTTGPVERLRRSIAQQRPLRQQVYEFLKREMNVGRLSPGSHVDLNELASGLGISRTPLREALLQLDSEGFVRILPRRGVIVSWLTLDEIRHVYEIVGALESAAVMAAGERLKPEHIGSLRELNERMRDAIGRDDFALYYDHNLRFHDVFLDMCDNGRLVRYVRLLKERLYDFPRRKGFVKEWEVASIGEHVAFVDLIERGDVRGGADFLRDVHWSFKVQEQFIMRYYFDGRGAV